MRNRNWVDRTRPLWRVGNRIEAFQQRRLGFSLMSLFNPGTLLIIETTGRRSGRLRYTPIGYWHEDDGAFLVGAGAAGMTVVPDWVLNLRARPEAAVWIRRRRIPVIAHEMRGHDRDHAQEAAARIWRGVRRYERLSRRVIPYFRLVASE